jgi:hypothetical protein
MYVHKCSMYRDEEGRRCPFVSHYVPGKAENNHTEGPREGINHFDAQQKTISPPNYLSTAICDVETGSISF